MGVRCSCAHGRGERPYRCPPCAVRWDGPCTTTLTRLAAVPPTPCAIAGNSTQSVPRWSPSKGANQGWRSRSRRWPRPRKRSRSPETEPPAPTDGTDRAPTYIRRGAVAFSRPVVGASVRSGPGGALRPPPGDRARTFSGGFNGCGTGFRALRLRGGAKKPRNALEDAYVRDVPRPKKRRINPERIPEKLRMRRYVRGAFCRITCSTCAAVCSRRSRSGYLVSGGM